MVRGWRKAGLLLIAAAGCGGGGSGVPREGGARDGNVGDSNVAEMAIDVAAGDALGVPPDVADAAGADGTARDGTVDATVDASVDAPVDASTSDATPSCLACTEYAPAQMVGSVQTTALNALSGMAASPTNSGVLYVHNDRDRAEFFAVSEAGALLGQFTVTGATVRDLEDMAVGPCPTGTCVYLADIGDNSAARTDYAILRISEPPVSMNGAAVAVPFERLVFTYPDGAHNAESLLVDPRTAALYVITKVAAGAPSAVYRLPAAFGAASAAATKIADLPVPGASDQPATSASAHPCGTGFLLRTNNTLYEFRIAPGTPFEDSFRAAPLAVPVGQEQQGEAVTYRPDGRAYFTTSEGATPPIHRIACR